MKHSSAVLAAFSILGPEEILKLSEVISRPISLKKVSGDSLVILEEDESPEPELKPREPAKVLKFPSTARPVFEPLQPAREESKSDTDQEPLNLLTGDATLLQREIGKGAVEALQRTKARVGYKKATEAFVIKTKDVAGKEKIRFASTNGVLVDKKQA